MIFEIEGLALCIRLQLVPDRLIRPYRRRRTYDDGDDPIRLNRTPVWVHTAMAVHFTC
jgi:hypothetical protein